jgi:hypothetical protein
MFVSVRYSEEQARVAIASSLSFAEALRKLAGLRPTLPGRPGSAALAPARGAAAV